MSLKHLVKEKLTYLGEGRNREGYLSKSGKYVFKVPIHGSWGEFDNRVEHDNFRQHKNTEHGRRLARCRLFGDVLVMEFVQQPNEESLPEWTDFIDCQQVGYNKNGELVAYDYAQ